MVQEFDQLTQWVAPHQAPMVSFILARNEQGARNWLVGFNLVCALLSSVAFSNWKQQSIF